MTSFDTLLHYIETETGFASSYYDESYLERRISARMRRTRTETHDDYRELLETDDSERAALLDTLSVNVTSFFRDEKIWHTLQDVMMDLVAERGSLDIWSAACADGREPYSLAMAALDTGIDSWQVDVLATDIDENALNRARQGRYVNTKTTSIDDQLSFLETPSAHVDGVDDSFVVRDTVKSRVAFERHDLITDDPKTGFDLVCCRNVCIYIDKRYKLPILRNVSGAVRPGGYLVLGQTETLPTEVKQDFEAIDPRLRIYERVE